MVHVMDHDCDQRLFTPLAVHRCGGMVHVMDHDCVWIGTVVCESNHPAFVGFLLAAVAAICLHLACLATVQPRVVRLLRNTRTDRKSEPEQVQPDVILLLRSLLSGTGSRAVQKDELVRALEIASDEPMAGDRSGGPRRSKNVPRVFEETMSSL